MVQYRSPYKNFYSDKTGSYMTIGAIVPSLVDSYSTSVSSSITGEGVGGEDPSFNYRNFLYCDGERYDVKDYPLLFEKIGNEYNLTTEAVENNAIRSEVTGAPGTVYRTFVDNGNVFAEIHSEPIPNSSDYTRLIPNGAQLTFEVLGDYPTANGQVVEGQQYLLEYSDTFQSLASQADTHVFRILINYDPNNNSGGSPGGTVNWVITSTTLIQTSDINFPLILPEANYGTVPAIDPGTYDPLTGQGYPTGYSQYANANNDTPAFSWTNLSGLPVGVNVDNYEILIEDLSTDVKTNWHVQNISNTTTAFGVNQQLPVGATLQQNSVEQSSIGSAPQWVNNGYSGPQPPTGEKHIYRFHVQATLNNSQQICTYQDFTAGGGSLIPLYNRSPQLTENLTVTGGNSGIVDTSLDVVISSLANQPRIKIRKAFSISDLPQVLGKFRVPDYRDRKLIGFGQGVDGAGTPLVGDRVTMKVGDVGGQWFIGTDTIEDPAEFYEISDVLTTGYTSVTTLIQPYLTGEKKYTVGPVEDYIFARPPAHQHNVLGSEPDETTQANPIGVDRFTTGYSRVKGYVENFIPNLPTGETLGHSHGLLGYRPLSPRTSTYGNVAGIGEKIATNALDDLTWDVDSAELTWTLNGTALLDWGNGVGEVGGFLSPGSGTKYLGFGSTGSTTFATHQSPRQASFTLNVAGYTKFFALGIMGNDINGGERCNSTIDNLRIRFTGAGSAPTSSWYELMESAGTYNINNNIGSGYGAYDAVYQVWKNREIDIPTIYQDAAEQPLTIEFEQTSDTGVTGGDPIGEYRSANNISGTLNNPAGTTFHPNGYDAVGLAKIGLRAGSEGTWDNCYNYKITEPGSLPIVSASASAGVLTVIFVGTHSFEIGDNVILANTLTDLDGAYTILEANFTPSSFQALCDVSNSAAVGSVRLASGYFTDVPVTPTPRVWVVDDSTTIGGKEIIVTTPGEGEVRFENTYDSGTANIPSNEGGENITSYVIRMVGGGAGGGGSSGAGGDGFDSSVTLTVDGNPYTIIAGGGVGGQAGSNGGQGGQGGTYTIPAAIFNDPRFTFDLTSNGDNGTTGGVGNGATPAGGQPVIWNDKGNGGSGSYDNFTNTGSATQTWSTSTTSWTQVYGPAYSAGQNYVELTGQSSGSWVTTFSCQIQISPVRTSDIKTTATNTPNGLGQYNYWKDMPTVQCGLNWDLGTANAIQGSTIFGQPSQWVTVYPQGASVPDTFMETTSNGNGLVIDAQNPDEANKSGMMGFHFYKDGKLRAINPYGRNGPSYENGTWNYWGPYRFKGGNQLPGTSDIAIAFNTNGDMVVTGHGFAQIDFNFEWLDSSSNGYALGTVSWQIGGQTVSFTQNQGQTSGQDLSVTNIAVTANTTYPCTITGGNGAGFDVIPSPPAYPGLCFKDGDGSDCNAKVEVIAINNQSQTRYECEIQQMQFPQYEHSPTQRFTVCEVGMEPANAAWNQTAQMNFVAAVQEEQLQGGGGGGTYTYYYNGASVGSNADGAQIVTGATAGSFRYSKGTSAGTNLWNIRVEELTVTGSSATTGSINVNDITGVPDEEDASVTYVDFDISGGAGGNGPANGIGGCAGGYGGGTASPGRRVTGRLNSFNGSLGWTIGQQGSQGVNQQVGSTGEPSAPGGNGADGVGNGGPSGSGAWGNGGSGGGGGGATGLYVLGGQAIAGAGGGGGGGGSGGGWNGGGITDPCWTGGAGLGPTQGLYESNLFTFQPGNSGGSKGCTSGGGGGGGGGAGPSSGGAGGAGGVAGAGHVNTGSGSGGNAGRSAISTTFVTSPSESAGSTGGGYVTLTAYFEEDGANPSGGGGGSGAGLRIGIQPLTTSDDISTSFFVEVGAGGAGGAGGQGAAASNGNAGRVEIGCFGRTPGDDDVTGISDPAGVYYEVPNFPDGAYDISNAGAPITGAAANIWHSSSEEVAVVGSVGDNFAVASNISNGVSNRHIRYTGLGNRFLQIGPLNLLNADKITFGVIKGNGSNGGEAPEEAIDCYYKVSVDATSESILQAVATPQGVSTSGWANYTIDIDEESDARINGIYLIVRQTRPDGSGDNPNEQGGSVNDNWGLAMFGVRYATYTERLFVPTLNAQIPGNEGTCGPEDGIDEIRRVVTAKDSNIRFTDGTLTLSSSTPISVNGTASVQDSISLVTKYHRSKYLIKAM